MRVAYLKPALGISQQIDLLIARGLAIADLSIAAARLEQINYYRLSAYWHPLRQRDALGNLTDQFEVDAVFTTALNLYEFDRRLRLLVLDAVERIEIALRTRIAFQLAKRHGPFGYTDSGQFHPAFAHSRWLQQTYDEVTRSKEEFIRHYRQKYSGFPSIPVWMLTETISLGNLSQLYKGLQSSDKKQISVYFGIHYRALANWLHVLTYVRNVCAHHGRLWNRELAIRPELPSDARWRPPITPRNDRSFFVLLILRQMLTALGNSNDWQMRCTTILQPIATTRRWRVAMGMPDEWQTHPLWQDSKN